MKERERKALLLLLLLLALVAARSPLCLGEAKTGEKSSMDLSVPAGLPYRGVKLVFTDLDGTLYPGDRHEEEPKAEKPRLMRNMAMVTLLESHLGVPVVPATGNNVGFAQKKMLDPSTGAKLRDLSTMPGIYCNGALVLGAGGEEVDVRHLGAFVPGFVTQWLGSRSRPPRCADICIAGLAKERTLLMGWPGLSAVGRRTASEFTTQMMIDEPEFAWLEPEAFGSAAESILSLLILFPNDPDADAKVTLQLKLDTQAWLHAAALLDFDDATTRLSNGEGPGVVCKHVHVPGLGPEIDISPSGVNKGSAIMKLLAGAAQHLGVEASDSEIAVFGDAGNDIELFGMKRDRSGDALEPLGLSYRPAIRCAMPWANDDLLRGDANVIAGVDSVLRQIVHEKDSTLL